MSDAPYRSFGLDAVQLPGYALIGLAVQNEIYVTYAVKGKIKACNEIKTFGLYIHSLTFSVF